MALYEVVLSSDFGGEHCVNRWNYQGTGTPTGITGAWALAQAFGVTLTDGVFEVSSILGLLQIVVSVQVEFIDLLVKNLYDPLDFYVVPFAGSPLGVATGQALPPFAAYGFQTTRARRDIRRATKRFVGVSETYQANGTVDETFLGLQLANLAAAMNGTLTYTDAGNNLSFIPTVCSKQRYDPDTGLGDTEGRAYRYYLTEEQQLAHIAQGFEWIAYPTVRSQSSRQFGHGT